MLANTAEGMIMGTPSYMSPEQASGEIRRIGPATDIHALGVILYELLAGRRPFEGGTPMEMLMQVQAYQPEPPSRWRPGLPRDLDAICLKCLEKDTERRYSTAAALADDLERFLAGQADHSAAARCLGSFAPPFLIQEVASGSESPWQMKAPQFPRAFPRSLHRPHPSTTINGGSRT